MAHNANNNIKWEQFSANQRALSKELSATKPNMGESSAAQRPSVPEKRKPLSAF